MSDFGGRNGEEKLMKKKLLKKNWSHGYKRTANRAEPSFIISTPVITVSSCTLFMTNRFIFFIICFTGVPFNLSALYRPRPRAIRPNLYATSVFFFRNSVFSQPSTLANR